MRPGDRGAPHGRLHKQISTHCFTSLLRFALARDTLLTKRLPPLNHPPPIHDREESPMLTETPTYDDLLHTLRTPDVEFTASWDTRWLGYGPCDECGDRAAAIVTWSEPIYETHGRYDDDGPFDVEVDHTDEELLSCYGCLQTTLDHVLNRPQRDDPCIEAEVCAWWLHFAGMPHTHIDDLHRLKALVAA